ncbi:MAG: hypothetical protein KGM60_01285 [Comamonadaceae bacterium]|nr:hypothetical protein [Comamonadaceae bacterium]
MVIGIGVSEVKRLRRIIPQIGAVQKRGRGAREKTSQNAARRMGKAQAAIKTIACRGFPLDSGAPLCTMTHSIDAQAYTAALYFSTGDRHP